jgi:hypothetical protein
VVGRGEFGIARQVLARTSGPVVRRVLGLCTREIVAADGNVHAVEIGTSQRRVCHQLEEGIPIVTVAKVRLQLRHHRFETVPLGQYRLGLCMVDD